MADIAPDTVPTGGNRDVLSTMKTFAEAEADVALILLKITVLVGLCKSADINYDAVALIGLSLAVSVILAVVLVIRGKLLKTTNPVAVRGLTIAGSVLFTFQTFFDVIISGLGISEFS